MANKPKCSNCGASLTHDAWNGVCPKCLLEQALLGGDETSAPSSPAGLKVGYIGDYELLKEIARGGMGVVFKARQVSLNRLVAVKMILSGHLATEAEVKRFRQEAEAAANLDHPNIVSIYEVGQFEGLHYFSMQLIEGHSLTAEAQPVTGNSWSEGVRSAAKLMTTVARAVHYAHQRGILHRDLKPGNILLDAKGEPHVTDFGLAKRVEGARSLTLSGSVMGTPSFMAPEQAAGKSREITAATDIYSLGAVLYCLLTGRPPFEGQTPLEVMRKVVDEEPIRPSLIPRSHPPGVNSPLRTPHSAIDKDLETICLKCLEKAPHRRYASADALADDLERWLTGEPILARPATNLQRAMKWAKRKPAIVGLSATVILMTALGLAALLRNTPNSSGHPNNPSPIGPAALMVQPKDTTAAAGSTATFGVVPVGEVPLSFQWKKDGADLADDGRIRGATTTKLTIANVQAGDLGDYAVAVSNVHGSMVSTAAHLLFAPPTFEWVQSGGGPGPDESRRIVVDRLGNVYAVGRFSNTVTFANATLTARGSFDAFIAKYNRDGRLEWARQSGGPGYDCARGVGLDESDDCYISGTFNETTTFADTNLTSTGNGDVFIAKYSKEGRFVWVRQGGGTGLDESYGLTAGNSGGCIVTGYFDNRAAFDNRALTSEGRSDMFVVRYDANGNLVWAVQAGGRSADRGLAIAVDDEDVCYVTGSIVPPAHFSDLVVTGRPHKEALFISKIGSTGAVLWVRQIDDRNEPTFGTGIAVDGDHNVYVVGAFGYSKVKPRRILIAKFNASGLLLWEQRPSGIDSHVLNIAVDRAGNSYVVGDFQGTVDFGDATATSRGNLDVFVAKYDHQGRLQWVQQASGTGANHGNSIALGEAGQVHVAGWFSGTAGFGNNVMTSRGETDMFVTKLVNLSPSTQARSTP